MKFVHAAMARGRCVDGFVVVSGAPGRETWYIPHYALQCVAQIQWTYGRPTLFELSVHAHAAKNEKRVPLTKRIVTCGRLKLPGDPTEESKWWLNT
jgi:hypothetical protein